MFENDIAFNQDLSGWSSNAAFPGIKTFATVFAGCTGLASCNKRTVYNAWYGANDKFGIMGETNNDDYIVSWSSDECAECPAGMNRHWSDCTMVERM